jgi:hypothetical protein
MSHGKAAARDIRLGRRGGGWVDPDKAPLELARLCPVCDRPMVGGQTAHHATCTPLDATCTPPDDQGALDL